MENSVGSIGILLPFLAWAHDGGYPDRRGCYDSLLFVGKSPDFFNLVLTYNCVLWELSRISKEAATYAAEVSLLVRLSIMASGISDCSCFTALYHRRLNIVLSAHHSVLGICYASFNKKKEGGVANAQLHHQQSKDGGML